MKIKLEITADEASTIAYALRELSNHRRKQSIAWGGASGDGARRAAELYYELSNRIDDDARRLCNES